LFSFLLSKHAITGSGMGRVGGCTLVSQPSPQYVSKK